MFVVRDKNNMLCGYKERPTLNKDKGEWNNLNDSDDGCCLSSCKFNNYVDVPTGFEELKWDDEPREVELVPQMLNAVQEKLSEAVDNYFDYTGHVLDIHNYSKEREQEYYNNICWRWQDWNTVKYDPKSTWDLNFEDYVGSTR